VQQCLAHDPIAVSPERKTAADRGLDAGEIVPQPGQVRRLVPTRQTFHREIDGTAVRLSNIRRLFQRTDAIGVPALAGQRKIALFPELLKDNKYLYSNLGELFRPRRPQAPG